MSAVSPLLSGTHGPIADESVFDDLPVIGEVPQDLNGALLPQRAQRPLPAARPLPLVRRRRHAARRLFRPRPRHLPQPLGAHAVLPRGGGRRPRALVGNHGAAAQRTGRTCRSRTPRTPTSSSTPAASSPCGTGRASPTTSIRATLETIGPADFTGTLHRTSRRTRRSTSRPTSSVLRLHQDRAVHELRHRRARRHGPQDGSTSSCPARACRTTWRSRRSTRSCTTCRCTYDPEAYAAGRHKLRFFGRPPGALRA